MKDPKFAMPVPRTLKVAEVFHSVWCEPLWHPNREPRTPVEAEMLYRTEDKVSCRGRASAQDARDRPESVYAKERTDVEGSTDGWRDCLNCNFGTRSDDERHRDRLRHSLGVEWR